MSNEAEVVCGCGCKLFWESRACSGSWKVLLNSKGEIQETDLENDNRELRARLREVEARETVLANTLAEHYEIDATECKAVSAFRVRAIKAVRALFHNSEVNNSRWNLAIVEAVKAVQSTNGEAGNESQS